jgi:hypothetical protein
MSQQQQLSLNGLANLWTNHLSPEERLILQSRLQQVIDATYRQKFENFQLSFESVSALLNSTINTAPAEGVADGKYEEAKQS